MWESDVGLKRSLVHGISHVDQKPRLGIDVAKA